MSQYQRLSLFWRLFLPIALVVLCTGSLRTWMFLNEERVAQTQAMQNTLAVAAATLHPIVTKSVNIGDYSSIQDQLDREVLLRPYLSRAEWRMGREQLVAKTVPITQTVPSWFIRLSGIKGCEHRQQVQSGGADYGELILHCDATLPQTETWQRALNRVATLGGVITVLFIILALTLRTSLVALTQLVDAYRRFLKDHRTRVAVGGAREIQQLGSAFNAMADEVEATLKALAEAQGRLQKEAELNHVTLMSIGDGVITTDPAGLVTQMNPVAEQLTGWPVMEAVQQPLTEIFRIVQEGTRETAINPIFRLAEANNVTALETHILLIARDGSETPIEDSAAPILRENGDIIGYILVFSDVSEKKALQKKIGWQATHDALTKLPNRALLADRLNQAVARSDRSQLLMAVGLLDLDEFKPVNDRLGHASGDQLLKLASTRMLETLRSTDTLARLGGDEFVLVLSDLTSISEAETIFGRLLDRLADPYTLDGDEARVTASLGFTLYPLDQADADTLLRHADEAMYAAKHAGRNRYHLFDAQHDQKRQARQEQAEEIRRALASGEFELFYQPKVDMRQGRVTGFEALARWRHPQRGIVPPGEFLHYMEDNELGSELGRFALDTALGRIAEWRRAGINDWSVAVNIAPQHFTAPHFLDDLKSAIARQPDVPPQCLELEIVESAAIADLHHAARVIAACHELGIRLALDDFGVGYASLSYLKRLPVDVLKIDQSFVHDVLDDPGDLAVVEAVITLSTLFGRDVVAEGVEVAEQGVLLLRLGCHIAQGYGIARPMPADEVAGWAATWQPDPSWALWANTQWEMSDFPLLVAQYDHQRWVKSVLNTLDGGRLSITQQELTNHRACRLGHWYENHGRRRYGHLTTFQEMEPLHAEVHRTGQEILQLKAEGRLAEAETQARYLAELKTRILDSLARLQQEVMRTEIGDGKNLPA
ncbi:EAL domain-containing protein [Sedimenticola sp.]|uniref:EAL domain-containing protein n=1 Tax=Sedimenticola sp. TaxID=1940285 RepID=UPI002584A2BB|nr:EAL domain-containing protein [Sedimenticola sp.]MCW8902327.1 EAL domain-containing protein [Sedimenticola sp.]